MGVLLLADLAVRSADLHTMYTDDGMFSRAEICRRATTVWNWSFHFGSGSPEFQAFLFALAGVFALALLAGFQTRLAVVGSWLMLVSIHHRAPPILSGAENLLRMLLFWAMFLPLQSAWSVDRWQDRRRGIAAGGAMGAQVFSIASAASLLQMAMMYLFSAIAKTNADWLGGKALAGTLAHDFYAAPLGAWLLQFPRLLTGLTWGTLALEWVAPILLFIPAGTARVRLVLIAGLGVMHLAIGVLLDVGMFSYVSLAGLALFLPSEFWNSSLLRRWSIFELRRDSAAPTPGLELRTFLFRLTQGLCLMALIYVVAININNLPSRPLGTLGPERWRPLTRGFGLTQGWGMFGSIPSRDGWYVARARLTDGSEVDLLRQGAAIDWTKPEFPARLYPNHYWRKLFREMSYDDEQGFQLLRSPVGKFLCRQWNAANSSEKQVVELDFVFCTRKGLESGNDTGVKTVRESLLHLDLSRDAD